MAYIGVQPTDTYLSIASQQITGTGSATYTLNYSVSNEEDVAVFVNNVRQNVSSYTVSGDQLTLGGTISASDECWVLFLGRTVGTKTPAVGSVTSNMLASGNINLSGGSFRVEDGYAYGYGDNSYRIEGKDDGANARIGFVTGNSEIARFTTSGLHIGGTGSANALDDYEEGSFTPSLDIETGANISVTTIQGYYRKIGNLVAFTIFCVWDKTAGSANMKFTGLPFTCSNQTNLSSQAVNWLQGAYTDQGAFFGGRVFGSSTDVYFVDSKHGSFNSNFDTNNAGRIANTTGIRTYVNGTYFTT